MSLWPSCAQCAVTVQQECLSLMGVTALRRSHGKPQPVARVSPEASSAPAHAVWGGDRQSWVGIPVLGLLWP